MNLEAVNRMISSRRRAPARCSVRSDCDVRNT